MTLPFFKYHGLGNDFVLIESAPNPLDPDFVRQLCDRHFGIGADGVLQVSPDPDADARMIVFNADGSRPEMCGNGLRCVALHVANQLHHHPTSVSVTITTDAGLKDCLVHLTPEDPEAIVTVDLGPVAPPTNHTLTALGQSLTVTTTSVGNPHTVILDPSVPFQHFAPALASHPSFPAGTNVTFAHATEQALVARVWERGVGPTLACGTAACATAAVAIHHGLAQSDTPIHIQLPGGSLDVTLRADTHAILTGPARRVFHGTLQPLPR